MLRIQAMRAGFLDRLRQHRALRDALAWAALLALLSAAAWCAFQLAPRRYHMRITGGDITSNQHFLARGLQQEAAANGVLLDLRPSAGSQEALALVAAGEVDLAFIQGGLDLPYPHVVHVATVTPELLHVLARPSVQSLAGLRGKRVNLGSRQGGTRIIATALLGFAGLRAEVDFVESNLSTEELLTLRSERLPDALVIRSFAPSEVVDYLIRQHGYVLLDVPFASAFAQRHDWAIEGRIMAGTYGIEPVAPPRAISTVGVNLRLVANDSTDPRAIASVLESLYGAPLGARLKLRFDEAQILASATYPPAEGTRLFMAQRQPLQIGPALDKASAQLGLAVSLVSTLLVIVNWCKGALLPAAGPDGDDTCLACLARLGELEARYGDRLARGTLHQHEVDALERHLSAIKAATLASIGRPLQDKQLPANVLLALAELRARLDSLRRKPMPNPP
ncbi:TAXI family TRAP transporter solute-binding subunit [Pseudoduganella armeniaca]|uniref:SsuA/THI5-like domain-containing protein n=1 Tax=Pseudoduganella armeniaca TaxID=2072590 RepID=A0A2R4CCG0_9BURK|nr:TAXI family TRAP transporter solute-binding subunit [Pseudoduganella armeniaca]AVR97178.1 hypothetical protein C9I28_17180 [Pseudoduganella armeniaca]